MIQFPDDPRDNAQKPEDEDNMPVLEATPAADQGVTTILGRMGQGDRHAIDELTPLVYHELKRVARKHLYSERNDHTLQCTALVHEAYLRLSKNPDARWNGKGHFFGAAAEAIGFDKPLGEYAEREALQVIGAIVTCFTNAMAAHHEMAKYPPVRGMPEVRDPLTDFSDLEDEAFWEKSQ